MARHGTAVVFVALVFWRGRIHRRTEAAPNWPYLICAAGVVAALTLQGHLGGSMSFASDDSSAGQYRAAAFPIGGIPNTTQAHDGGKHTGHALRWRDHIDLKD
jgi:hypothetical protein